MQFPLRLSVPSLAVLGLGLGLSLGSAIPGLAAEVAVGVSPGAPSRADLVESRCPTFSWGAVPEARGYELVVYRLGEEGEEAELVLRRNVTGTASSWTPALDRCLARGGDYAWTVRAVASPDDTSDWSPLLRFAVAAGPSPEEFERALRVVESYLETTGKSEPAAAPRSEPAPGASEEPRAPATVGPPAETQLDVDGNIAALSFTGDGSNLAGVATDGELSMHESSVTAHHAPTVDTTCSGAACDGSLFTGLNADNLASGTVAEPRIDAELARDAELAAALDALDCPPGQLLRAVDGGTPVCAMPLAGQEATLPPFTGGPGVTITSGIASPYPAILTVGSFDGTLSDVNATLTDVEHTYQGDVGLLLVAPSGEAVVLMRSVGSTADLTTVDLTFDDEAAQPIGAGPASGSYQPVDNSAANNFPSPAPPGPYGTSLSVFDGIDPVGDWKLFVDDSFDLEDDGSLASWSLELTSTTADIGVLLVANGGTGAADAAGARANLDAAATVHTHTEADVTDLSHTTDTNAGTICGPGRYLDGDGTCKLVPVDTNAGTICGAGQYLDGDGTCKTVPVDTNAGTICAAGQYLDGDGTCKTSYPTDTEYSVTANVTQSGTAFNLSNCAAPKCICFLTSVYLVDDNNDDDILGCRVQYSAPNWQIVPFITATDTEVHTAEVVCRARCLKWP